MKRGVLSARLAVILGLLVSVCWCVGCGSEGPPVGSISGKVTYNGEPVTGGIVTLFNQQTGIGAGGELDASGTYHIELIQTGDYQVAIAPEPPDLAAMEAIHLGKMPRETIVQPPPLNIPARYQNAEASGLTATAKEGTNTVDFSL